MAKKTRTISARKVVIKKGASAIDETLSTVFKDKKKATKTRSRTMFEALKAATPAKSKKVDKKASKKAKKCSSNEMKTSEKGKVSGVN